MMIKINTDVNDNEGWLFDDYWWKLIINDVVKSEV